jgi:hypothetical protein
MSGIYWGDGTNLLKQILLDVCARCQTFAFAVHTGAVWVDKKPTMQRKPKGKRTFMELATLYIHLDRPIGPDGSQREVPTARVIKSRLATEKIDENGNLLTIALMPPQLPEATPEAIRRYMVNPPNWNALRPEEKAPEVHLSEDAKLELRAQTAANEADAARARLEEASVRQRESNGGDGNGWQHPTQQPQQQQTSPPVQEVQLPARDAINTEVPEPSTTPPDDSTQQTPQDEQAGQTVQDALAASANGTAQEPQASPFKQAAESLRAGDEAGFVKAASEIVAQDAQDMQQTYPDGRLRFLGPSVSGSCHRLLDEVFHLAEVPLDARKSAHDGLMASCGIASWEGSTDDQKRVVEAKLIEKLRALHVARGTVCPF